LLEEQGLPETERREMLKTAADEAARLNRLVANLLAMTRLEAGALEVKRSWHSLEDLVGAALHRLEPVIGGRAVKVDLAPDLPLVPVDDVLIEQVIFNLVENASRHAPSDEPIEIRARVQGDKVEVVVMDRGPGFAPGTEDQLFEKFYRGEGAQSAGGVGLGLAICRGIVEAHGGRIRAANRPGGGALFVFTLPLGAGPPQIEAEPVLPEEAEIPEVRHG
jgi:two-component system sensor histidine kinase KdpD